MKQLEYFLGSNTRHGFHSYFDNILKPQSKGRLYIIKGGPGSGKSTLMRRLSEEFLKSGDKVEKFYCSSDPGSLDGVLSVNKRVAIIDGTNPHAVEPKYAGAFETIINTADGFDTKKLKENYYKIETLNKQINAHHKNAVSLIKKASILREQTFIKAEKYLNYDVIYTMAELLPFWRFLHKTGDENIRLLSAVSVNKTVFFQNTLTKQRMVYSINDSFGPASHFLIKKVRTEAAKYKLARTLCPCGINPERLEHIIFPEGVAFTTQNPFHYYMGDNTQSLDGFYLPIKPNDLKLIEAEKAQASEFIALATKEIAKSKMLHDELEKIYISSMDFSVIDRLYEKIVKDLV